MLQSNNSFLFDVADKRWMLWLCAVLQCWDRGCSTRGRTAATTTEQQYTEKHLLKRNSRKKTFNPAEPRAREPHKSDSAACTSGDCKQQVAQRLYFICLYIITEGDGLKLGPAGTEPVWERTLTPTPVSHLTHYTPC